LQEIGPPESPYPASSELIIDPEQAKEIIDTIFGGAFDEQQLIDEPTFLEAVTRAKEEIGLPEEQEDVFNSLF